MGDDCGFINQRRQKDGIARGDWTEITKPGWQISNNFRPLLGGSLMQGYGNVGRNESGPDLHFKWTSSLQIMDCTAYAFVLPQTDGKWTLSVITHPKRAGAEAFLQPARAFFPQSPGSE